MAIATRTEYKTYAGLSGTTFDDRIDAALLASEATILGITGLAAITSATYTDEAYDGNGGAFITLRNVPVTAVSAVKTKDNDGDTDTLATTEYRFDAAGRLFRLGAAEGFFSTDPDNLVVPTFTSVAPCWPVGMDNVLVTYTGGQTAPSDVKQVQFEMIDQIIKAAGSNPNIQSESIGDYSYTLATGEAFKGRQADWRMRLRRYTTEPVL